MTIDPKRTSVVLRVRSEDGAAQADVEMPLEEFAKLFRTVGQPWPDGIRLATPHKGDDK